MILAALPCLPHVSTRQSYCSYFMDEVNEAQRDDAGLGLVLDLSRTCVLKH